MMIQYWEWIKPIISTLTVNQLSEFHTHTLRLLEGRACNSLYGLLYEIVELIVKPLITRDGIATLYSLLNEHHNFFAKVYDTWKVTIIKWHCI